MATGKYFTTERMGRGKRHGDWPGRFAILPEPPRKEGWTISELSSAIGVPKRTIHDLFDGRVEPTGSVKIERQVVPTYKAKLIDSIGKEFERLSAKGEEVFKIPLED